MTEPLRQDPLYSPASELPPRPQPPRYWLYALVAVFVFVCVALVAILNFWSAQKRLERDKLDAARLRWRESGIKDYNLDIAVSGALSASYHIRVRNGQPAEGCTQNDKPFENPNQIRFWTVEGLLEEVLMRELENIEKDPSCHSQVVFDAKLGYPVDYMKVSKENVTRFALRLQTTDLEKKLPAFTLGGAAPVARGGGMGGRGTRPTRPAPSSSASGSRPTSPAASKPSTPMPTPSSSSPK